jgi:hypoxanthine phosphoribosyltransferase
VFELDSVKKIIPQAAKLLKGMKFDAIAFRGMSGCLFAAPLSLRLRKPLLMVRKPCACPSSTHTKMKVEGDINAQTYIIVDDFIGTGRTVREIISTLQQWAEFDDRSLKCIGVLTAFRISRTFKECTYRPLSVEGFKLAEPETAMKGQDKYKGEVYP